MKYTAIFAAVLLLSYSAVAKTTVLHPSGGDDTAAIQNACNQGIAVLTDGVYNVSSVTCKNVVSASADAYFWYEGQQPTTKLKGVVSGVRGVLVCPSPGPCAYRGFEVNPPAGVVGIVLDSVHGAQLLQMSVIEDNGDKSSGACVDMNVNNGGDNQNFVVQGGTYGGCGGWCFDFSTVSDKGTSDSSWYGVDVSNCGLGGVHISFGYANQFVGNRIQDQFGLPGLQLDSGGDDVIAGNLFDKNLSDMALGTGPQGQSIGWYGAITGNQSCELWGGAMFDIEGPVQINASGNLSCSPGPSYLVGANGSVAGGFYDPNPTYAGDGGHTQALISPLVH